MTRIELLTFEGCPNHAPAEQAVRRLAGELAPDAAITTTLVADVDDARRRRFLGSPSVRVDGVDVEPGAEARDEYALACRVYTTEAGLSGIPDERWIRAAIERG